MHRAETIIQPLIDFVDEICARRTNFPFQPSKLQTSIAFSRPSPTIGVIMGFNSDLKILIPGLKLLKYYFGIEPEVDITSAHRTPTYMAESASTAASRGIKVVIAAAGGAANLPGMAAAYTSLPVIGLPVNGSTLDGIDRLYSIVQIREVRIISDHLNPVCYVQEQSANVVIGVPVAVVGINNTINAALLAVRILGAFSVGLRRKVKEFAKSTKEENLEVKGVKIRELGWETYYERMNER